MVNLDQVKLLDSKVTDIIIKAIKLEEKNNALMQQNGELKSKLDTNQKRIDDLETHIIRFREDQERIEESILATLEKINQFGEAISNKLNKKTSSPKTSKAALEPATHEPMAVSPDEGSKIAASEEKVCFEIPASDTLQDEETMDDIPDPLDDTDMPASDVELDIY